MSKTREDSWTLAARLKAVGTTLADKAANRIVYLENLVLDLQIKNCHLSAKLTEAEDKIVELIEDITSDDQT